MVLVPPSAATVVCASPDAKDRYGLCCQPSAGWRLFMERLEDIVPRSRGSSPPSPCQRRQRHGAPRDERSAKVSAPSDFDDSGTAVGGLGLLARVDNTADEATTDEGWDGEVALLEDALRYVRMVLCGVRPSRWRSYDVPRPGHFFRKHGGLFSGTGSPRKTLATEQHGLFWASRRMLFSMRGSACTRSCQGFFLFLASVVLSCSRSERVCAVPEALRSRAFGRDATESHSKMGLKVCKVAIQWICRFQQTS